MTVPAEDSDDRGRRPRRILLALDAAAEDAAALDMVAALAARLEAELLGLFVEDIDLIRLAALPEASATSMLSARRERLDTATVERVLRTQGAVSRRAVEAAAGRRQVKASFEVRRGRVVAEVLSSAESADLVIVNWASGGYGMRPGRKPARLGAIARAVAETSARPVLLLRRGARPGGPVMVAYDGSAAARTALVTAAEIAGSEAGQLVVALLARSPGDERRLQDEVSRWCAERDQAVVLQPPPGADPEALCAAARRGGAMLLVLGAGGLDEGGGGGGLQKNHLFFFFFL